MQLNTYQICDNLELLKTLSNNSINLIYSDILYGTGRNFADYKDLKRSKEEIYDFYKPRFKEIYRILHMEGSLYIQLDYRIHHWIRNILDDIFDYSNFRNEIIWKRVGTGKGAKPNKNYEKDYDIILFYSKSNEYVFNNLSEPLSYISLKEYKFQDEAGHFKLVSKGAYSKLSVENLRLENLIYTTKNGIEYVKYYLKDFKNNRISNIWESCNQLYNGANKEKVDYESQKPKALLERIINISSNKGDIVADFFAGSGTTLLVAKELGRNYLGCDINPKGLDIFNSRLK